MISSGSEIYYCIAGSVCTDSWVDSRKDFVARLTCLELWMHIGDEIHGACHWADLGHSKTAKGPLPSYPYLIRCSWL